MNTPSNNPDIAIIRTPDLQEFEPMEKHINKCQRCGKKETFDILVPESENPTHDWCQACVTMDEAFAS